MLNLLQVASAVVCVVASFSLHILRDSKAEFEAVLGLTDYRVGKLADYIAVIAAPFSVLMCIIYAMVRLLENTQATENMPDMTIRLVVRAILCLYTLSC